MPVISTRRYSSGSSSYLPPSVGGTTSSLSNLGKGTSSGYGSSYRSSSLNNSTYSSGYSSTGSSYLPRTSSYRTGLYNTSSSLSGLTSYRHSSYLTGGNNDSTATSRFGVSNNKYTRSSSDRDTKRISGKTLHNNNINTTVSNRTKPLLSKPPIPGSLRTTQRLSESQSRERTGDLVTSKSDQNSNCNNNCNELSHNSTAGQSSTGQDHILNNTSKFSSSLSSSSLARQVATSGLDFYEKYSPVHYIPKCELSRSRSLSEATTSKYNKENNLSNSSSNVHQLLHHKEVNKLQDSKDCKTTTSTVTSSPSSSKDISTTQLASKVKKLFAAASNTANNNIVENLNASSIVVLNNFNNHNQNKFIQADANNTPNKNPLQTDISTVHCLTEISTLSSSSDICSSDPTTSDVNITANSQRLSVVDTVSSSTITNNNNNSVVNNSHCKHSYTNSNHQEQAIQTCSNCNKTTATVFASSTPTQPQTQKIKDIDFKNSRNSSATIVNINSSADEADYCNYNQSNEGNKVNSRIKKLNLQTTKQLLSKKADDSKNMPNKLYKHWEENYNASANSPSSVTVTYHTTTTTVTIQSPNTVTTVNADINASTPSNKNNVLDLRLDFPKNKQAGKAPGENNSTVISSSAKEGATKSVQNQFITQSLLSAYKDQNFLKSECEFARSQVIKLSCEEDAKSAGFVSEENNNSAHTSRETLDKTSTSKNEIRPFVHKSSNNKIASKLAKLITNNNMNCLQNSSESLDDIKYIDSDDSERQQNSQAKSSSSSSSSTTPFEKTNFNHTKISSSSSSTLPLTSKQRDLINSDSNTKATTTNKFNTLNDFKRIPSSVRSSSHFVTSNKLLSSASTNIPSRISNNKPRISVVSTVINNISNSSREFTPPSSPQMLRRNNLTNSNSNLVQQHIPDHPLSSSSSSSSSTLNDKKLSNKLCDIDESVRNASIRSALPSSPTPSRYWDREGRTSGFSSRFNDTDDYSSTKSAINSAESHEKGVAEGLCGLRNIGNTCFMNSVIQCLSHTRELTKFLKTQTSVKSSSKDQQILYEFAKLIREMWTLNVRSVTPFELKSAFSSKHRMYSGYNQQDAQEFLRFFLDSLHCALNTGVKGDHLKIDDSLSDNRKADLTWDWYSKIENSVVRDLFVGQLKSTLKCTTCGNTSVTFDPFWDLSVPLPSSSRCKLDSCLELFIREEVLDGDEMPTCSKCQARRKCTKSFTIQRFPKYLVIHLKRFSETRWSKLSNIVEFPTGERELNMAPYASNSSTNALYSLYAISNHMGSTAGGHYVALCKHPITKKWHEFNDNVVSDDLSESVLVSSSAYLLFYERA